MFPIAPHVFPPPISSALTSTLVNLHKAAQKEEKTTKYLYLFQDCPKKVDLKILFLGDGPMNDAHQPLGVPPIIN